MNVSQVTAVLFLFVSACSTSSCLKNDRDGSSLNSDSNPIRHNRRISLNEYLVPPPPPKPHPVRAGRVANPSSTEPPGYFSQFVSWLNPFKFGSSPSAPQKSPPFLETPHPPPPQSYGAPPFNSHPPLPLAPSFHPSLGRQIGVPLYPPLGPPPAQNPSSLLSTPPGVHPGPPLNLPPGPPLNHPPGPSLNLPPGPSLHIYNPPPPTLHDIHHSRPPPKNDYGTHPLSNKGKPCNLCNKVPWVPMQSSALPQESYPPPPQLSNDYLPPSNQANHDIQHAASNEFRIPDFPQEPVDQHNQHSLNNPLPNPIVYSGPIAPPYRARPFDSTVESPPQREIVSHFEPPPLPAISSAGQKNHEIINEHYNVRGNDDLSSSGTQVNQGHVSAISQSHEIEINKGLTDYEASYGTSILDAHPPISGPSFEQGYRNNPPTLEQGNGGPLNQPIRHSQNSVTNLAPPNVENNFAGQSDNEYRGPFKPNAEENTVVNYLRPDLNPPISFGASNFNNQDTDGSNYQYFDDLSPSGSVAKDSHETTQTPLANNPSTNEGPIHFEESPLLDLTKKGESGTDVQWLTSTNDYTNVDKLSDHAVRTTTAYSRNSDKIYFVDSTNFIRPTESYSSSVIRNINNAFGPSTSTITGTSKIPDIETSTISPQNSKQQVVSYIPPSGQPGFLWPSLLLDTLNSRNGSSENQAAFNHLAQRNISSLKIKNSEQQDNLDLKTAKDPLRTQQNMKRNKQVQVIIPYTSDYTPIPFQQSHGDWSIKTNFEQPLARKVPSRSESNADNYVQQESKNHIRVINQLQSQYNVNYLNKLNGQTLRPPLTTVEDSRSATTKANNSIDVRRLQKNIDNWTIQEYSKPTTSSTILPSSLHPYLLPSKKIPTEYLTTTEPGDHTSQSKDHNEIVKTYSLAGFSFNEVEHEGSASNRIEETRAPINAIIVDSPKEIASDLQSINKSATGEKSTWEAHSVSISPVNKERVYVVTPQPTQQSSSSNDFEKRKGEGKRENSQRTYEAIVDHVNKSKNNFSEFEAIEKAYQVLPQAVNNLAVASTGKENIPLWGIMEHEEFVALNFEENVGEAAEDVTDGPVLYTGHSKVSRAKR